MSDRVLLVDLENIQKVDLSKIPGDVRVLIFYGLTQKKLPEELVVQAQPFGTRLQWIKIAGQGPNALDFHIAYYLGKTLTERPQAHCAVLSKDKGFDTLIRHLHGVGQTCRRVAALKDAFPAAVALVAKAAVAQSPDDFQRLVDLLKKDKARPVKRKGLEGKVKSWFAKHADADRAALVQRLFDENKVGDAGKGLVFSL